MKIMSNKEALTALLILLGTLAIFSPNALAQRAFPCSTCDGCTAALAAPDAKVVLSGDVVHPGEGPCIVIQGERAQLDGAEHDIRPTNATGTIGIQVEANDVLVKNIHVMGAETGILVKNTRRTTLFHAWIQSAKKGVSILQSPGFRITRSVLLDSQFGISFGPLSEDGTCPTSSTLQSPGAVINKVHVEESQRGIVACDAIPVIKNSTLIRNKVGISLGHPKGKNVFPTDPCACSPDLEGVTASTVLFFSSGCHSCQTHESWMPELKSQGHDFLMRQTGPGNGAKTLIYDLFIDRCLPQLTDAVGIPGCVPNYGCLTNDASNKVRNGKKNLTFETQITSAESLADLHTACASIATRSYGKGKDCVRHQLQDNVVCMNREMDIQATESLSKWGGINNACETTQGYKGEEGASCSQPCPANIETPTMPDSWEYDFPHPPPPTPPTPPTLPTPEASGKAPGPEPVTSSSNPEEASDESKGEPSAPSAENVPPVEEFTECDSTGCAWWIILAGVLLSLAVLWRIRSKAAEDSADDA
jgi:hypothetical protein